MSNVKIRWEDGTGPQDDGTLLVSWEDEDGCHERGLDADHEPDGGDDGRD